MYITAAEATLLYDQVNALAALVAPYWNTLVNNLDPPPEMEWEYEDRKAMLKACTLIVRIVDFDLACYPLSVAAVIFFDENGDPVP